MAVLPAHLKITDKQDWLETHRAAVRVPVPSREGKIVEVIVFHWFECSSIDGTPLDALIEGAPTRSEKAKRFGVLWSDVKPDNYPIPVLWVSSGGSVWL